MLAFLSYCLTVILVSVTISLYAGSLISIYTPIILMVCAATFGISSITKKSKSIGGIIVFIVIIVSEMLTNYGAGLGSAEAGGIGFWQWVITAGDEAEAAKIYIVTLAFAASVFFSFIVYYFTVALFRRSFLTLVSLLPCVLYIKVMIDMNNWYLVYIAFANICIYAYKGREDKFDIRKIIESKERLISLAAFAFIVLMISAAIPKNEDAIYFDKFENLFLNGDTTSPLAEDYGELSDFSGNADNYRNGTNRRLYNLMGDEMAYLKRQTFDLYNFELDRWYSDSSKKIDAAEWAAYQEKLQLDRLQLAIREAANLNSEYKDKYLLDNILDGGLVDDRVKSITLWSQNYPAVYLLQATRGIRAEIGEGLSVNVTENGVFLLDKSHGPNSSYRIEFYDNYSSISDWIGRKAANIDFESEKEFLEETRNILNEANSGQVEVLEAFIRQHDAAAKYSSVIAENNKLISKELRELAEKITEDCQYDWEKAAAIESYFEEEGFIYDLDQIFEDTSPEYFLFESKTGTCSDYASAFTLLARSAGLIVRYAEGYVPERGNNGYYYYINEKDGHAYPEVYIENTGWVIFEPTVAASEPDFWDYIKNVRMDFKLIYVIIAITVVVILFFLLINILTPLFVYLFYQIRIWLAPENKKCILRYKWYQRIAKRKGIANVSLLTPMEFSAAYTAKTGKDISDIAKQVEIEVYGK